MRRWWTRVRKNLEGGLRLDEVIDDVDGRKGEGLGGRDEMEEMSTVERWLWLRIELWGGRMRRACRSLYPDVSNQFVGAVENQHVCLSEWIGGGRRVRGCLDLR